MIEIQLVDEVTNVLQSQFSNQLEIKPLRVLVVEDDLATQPVWEHIIRSVNPKAVIRQAYTEEAAEKIIETQRMIGEDFDLIISDIFLDGPKNGVDLWRKYGKKQTLFLFTSIISKPDFVEMIGPEEKEFPLLMQKPVRTGKSIDLLRLLLNFKDFFTDRKGPRTPRKGVL